MGQAGTDGTAPPRRGRARRAFSRGAVLAGTTLLLMACPNPGPSGLHASYDNGTLTFNFNVGGPRFRTQWPGDAEITCSVSGIRITTVSTNLSGINAGIGGVCPPAAVFNSNPQPAVCRGNTTGQSASTTVVAPNFAPPNCCASIGGGNTHC